MLKTVIDYPKLDDEQYIVRANLKGVFEKIKPVVKIDEILAAQKAVREVYMDEKIERYILDIVFCDALPRALQFGRFKAPDFIWSLAQGEYKLSDRSKMLCFYQAAWLCDS